MNASDSGTLQFSGQEQDPEKLHSGATLLASLVESLGTTVLFLGLLFCSTINHMEF